MYPEQCIKLKHYRLLLIRACKDNVTPSPEKHHLYWSIITLDDRNHNLAMASLLVTILFLESCFTIRIKSKTRDASLDFNHTLLPSLKQHHLLRIWFHQDIHIHVR